MVPTGEVTRRHRAAPALAALCLVVAPVGGSARGDELRMPDPAEGALAGRAALSFWPQELGIAGSLLDPSGMTVHLVPLSDLDRELVFPCGEWILPEAGKYRFWLEGAGWISAAHGIFSYSAPPFQGRGSIAVRDVVPAGRVVLGRGVTVGPDDEIRLLHVESHNRLASPQPEMSRRLRGQPPADGVAMPAGQVVAAVYDRAGAEYRWVSQPFDVPAAGVGVAPARGPGERTDVLAVLDRPKAALSFEEYDVQPTLNVDGGGPVSPAVLVATAERLYAIWYGIEGRLGELTVESPSVHLPAVQIPLRAGRVESYRGSLAPLPSLTVHLDLPPELSLGEEPGVELSTFPERRRLRRHALQPGDRRIEFDRVPAGVLEIALDLPPWRFMERVDLADGLDREVAIRPRAVRVSGTVYRGDDPHEATVTFKYWTGEKYLHRVETDEAGHYETRLYKPSMLAWVELRGADLRPWVEILGESFEQDTVLDFHLPGNRWGVRVSDLDTGEPLAGAEVRYVSHRGVGKEALGKEVGKVETDAAGSAALPPLAPGEIWVTASAEGYQTPEFLKLPVAEEDTGRDIEIALQREEPDSSSRLTLTLSDGQPASGAELIAVVHLGLAEPSWVGTADGAGTIELPGRLSDQVLLIRHPAAGVLVRTWTGASTEPGEDWTLPAAAPPLTVRLHRSWGGPAPWSQVALQLGDVLLVGSLLQRTLGSSSADASGMWHASGLPAVGTVTFVAWLPAEDVPRDPVALLASFGTRISYPWNGTVEIEAIK